MAVEAAPATENATGAVERHPLQHRWALWYDNAKLKAATETWADNLKHILAFETVQEFWALFNNVMPPSMLSVQSNYSVFKEGVKPMWEDTANRQGGKFVLTVKGEDLPQLDQWWLHAVLSAIGETLESETDPEVCGLVVSLRKGQHRIALWTKTCEESRVVPVAKKLKEALKLPARLKFVFQTHSDAVSSLSSFQNASRYEV
ncbi:unnamed protein product [Ectocarpus sp. 12 AP-2014]